MIPRYSNKELETIWSTDHKYKIWLEIEILACEIQEKLGNIPKGTTKRIRNKAYFNKNRILEIEKETKHDVIAFLTNVAEYVGDDAKYIHKGLTSSDILDTCFSIQLVESSNIIIKKVKLLLENLKDKAYQTKNIITIGRSHGIHAEPTTMGLKFAYAYAEFNRCLDRLNVAKKEISICNYRKLERVYAFNQGLLNLKGHSAVGGLRASLYNSMSIEGVKALVNWLKEFEINYG